MFNDVLVFRTCITMFGYSICIVDMIFLFVFSHLVSMDSAGSC